MFRSIIIVSLFVSVLAPNSYSQSTDAPSPREPATQPVFVWTDSLINARGPFATAPSPEFAQPITVDGMQYWEGGVFVLPGTNVSVLTENGFLDVAQKPGSVMHDYYEARWPVGLALDNLPLSIRQIRYDRKPFDYPRPWPEIFRNDQPYADRPGFYLAYLGVVPGLPTNFFAFYDINRRHERQREGWVTEYLCWWSIGRNPEGLPLEFIYVKEYKSPPPK